MSKSARTLSFEAVHSLNNHGETHPQPEPAYHEVTLLAHRLTPGEGINRTLLSDVTVLRRSRSIPRRPILHEPSLIFVVQGRKRGFIADHRFRYDARTVLILSAPVPFECISDASSEKPLLAIYVRLRKAVILDVLAGMRQPTVVQLPRLRAIEVTTLDDELGNVILRLLRILTSADDTRILGAPIVRELIYLVLRRHEGNGLRAMVETSGPVAQIYRTLGRIEKDFNEPLSVADLARQAGMSLSTFHLHFKQITLTSPIQYIKAIRLHNAKQLILHSQLSAGAVAARVGYASASQFGREFKRFFGTTPAKISLMQHATDENA